MHPLLALSLVAVVLSATSCQGPSSTLPAGDGPLVVISAP
ncbi:MAG: hypothetical protein QOF95_2851, partial [Pseudonocardiales bacterium]|nr:hypothetical protein [Pseudonocardiales bacterium]